MSSLSELHPRERQIMDVIYVRGQATAAEVLDGLPDPPSYSAVRAMLRKLEGKGHVTHSRDGLRYVYHATHARSDVEESAVRRLMRTFFDGSPVRAVAAILDRAEGDLSDEELDELVHLIEDAREKGR